MFIEGNTSTWSHWRKAFSKYDLTSVFTFSLVADVDDVLVVVLLYLENKETDGLQCVGARIGKKQIKSILHSPLLCPDGVRSKSED